MLPYQTLLSIFLSIFIIKVKISSLSIIIYNHSMTSITSYKKTELKIERSWQWWHTPLIPILKNRDRRISYFKPNIVYTANSRTAGTTQISCLNNNKTWEGNLRGTHKIKRRQCNHRTRLMFNDMVLQRSSRKFMHKEEGFSGESRGIRQDNCG